MTPRWVLHVDLDQFQAAVEVRRRPELAGLPIIVGGNGDPNEPRKVVTCASYPARKFGVHAGMPLRTAARKCPDATFLPLDTAAYDEASEEVMDLLRDLGHPVEVWGWDEAYIGAGADNPVQLAEQIREVIGQTELSCSVGISDNKQRAKVATGFGKPRGVFRLTVENWLEVMGDRPTIDLWGVGSRISGRLAKLGISTVAELAAARPAPMIEEFGPRMGPWYALLGRGEGAREVDDTPWVARGHSRETTYQQDLADPAEVEAALRELAARVLDDVAAEGRPVVGLTLKVRYAPFITKTYQRRVPSSSDREDVLGRVLQLAADRIEPGRPIRLLGLRAEMAMPEDAREGHTPTRGGW